MIPFGAFVDELVKIAGVELDLVGYTGRASEKIKRHTALGKKLDRMRPGKSLDAATAEWEELGEQINDETVETPFVGATHPKGTWDVLSGAGKDRKWSPLVSDYAKSHTLSMPQLRSLKRDYVRGLQNPNRYSSPGQPGLKPGEVLPQERAWLQHADRLIKDPKVRFARLVSR